MAFDYSGLATVAAELIDQFGQDVTISRPNAGLSNPASGTVFVSAPTTFASRGIRTKYNENYQPGAEILQGDQMWIIDSLAEIGDSLVIGAESWRVVNTWEVNPGGTFLVCFVQVRA